MMVSPSRFWFLPALLLAVLSVVASPSARAQWAVYDMRMVADQESSVNFTHYTGAYLIAPLDGGQGSLIFTTEDEGRLYAVAQDVARFFIAGNQTKRRAVLSATADVGSSQSMYMASGALNNTFQYLLRGQRTVAIIASDITGQLMTADDERYATIPAIDGSKGVVGVASLKGFFRKDLSERLCADSPTMDQAVESITTLLEQYGYQSETSGHGTAPQAVNTQAAHTVPVAGSSSASAAAPTTFTPSSTPATPANPSSTIDGSLFPAGLREDMERMLTLQPTTK